MRMFKSLEVAYFILASLFLGVIIGVLRVDFIDRGEVVALFWMALNCIVMGFIYRKLNKMADKE